MTKKIHVLLLLFATSLPALAQVKIPANMFVKTLQNGLTVLVVEDNSVPLATVAIAFKTGAFTEPLKYSGLTGLYQMMLFKANKDYGNAEQVGYRTSVLGTQKNSTVQQEYGSCFFTLPSFNIEEGLKYMNSAMRFPVLNNEELEREKTITLAQLTQKESTASFKFNLAILQHLWGNLATRKVAIGTRDAINAATLSMVDSVKLKYYHPNNAIIIVAGKVSHDAIFKQVTPLFGSWQASAVNPFKKWMVPEFEPLKKTDYFITESNLATVPSIYIGWQGPDTRHDIPATYAADIFSYILTQRSSKLSKALVETGLAQEINFNYLTLAHGGEISFYIQPNPQKIKECLDEAKKQISLFDTDDYITDEQIQTAKRKLQISQERRAEITTQYVQTLTFWWASASLNYHFTYNDKIDKITKADVQAYVRKYIKAKPYCAGLLINPDLKAQVNADDFFKAN
ncbi:M16 family metallopeptidase [Mucilaginibacter kameinonensis]|uniref:M16 family metallopeptidase n=1 Tax=Mucilaginibacter kameinonensis TaxID=452286 RepID=UPI000EF7E153|nr:pitrilysin family protein [Mucilaginibacter kameinonensis]